ncbi:nicotinate (nicotinamide) nucleotide adenylyltransferase [Rhodohalobacter sp. 8-1]|uniref:nicotinate (nicotinamide) nucleotide adenylyltransferase n=1 Tax=Rhodohalobacter sp. 8-1 TaxID=3131972 RepID=UPI0030EE54A2
MSPAGPRTGLFGGAFDPVHHGHVKIAKSFLDSNLIDRLLVVPTPESPHKDTSGQTPFAHRFRMLQLAFRDIDQVAVSDIETHLSKPSYTLKTIRYLQDENPGNKYFLCIGEDSLASFHKWWEYEEILDRVPLIVAARPGADSSQQSQSILDRAIFVDHSEVEISSTEIRNRAWSGDNQLTDSVPEPVADYIHKKNLYSA